MTKCDRMQRRVFYAWWNVVNQNKKRDTLKCNATEEFVAIIFKNGRKSKKRAFDIWKQGFQSVDGRLLKLKTIMRRIHEKTIKKMWSLWVSYNVLVEHQVRMRILQRDAAYKLMVSQTFHQLRLAC